MNIVILQVEKKESAVEDLLFLQRRLPGKIWVLSGHESVQMGDIPDLEVNYYSSLKNLSPRRVFDNFDQGVSFSVTSEKKFTFDTLVFLVPYFLKDEVENAAHFKEITKSFAGAFQERFPMNGYVRNRESGSNQSSRWFLVGEIKEWEEFDRKNRGTRSGIQLLGVNGNGASSQVRGDIVSRYRSGVPLPATY